MNVLLTINGVGQRFLDQGFTKPKFMLDYHGSTIISQIIGRISQNCSSDTKLYIGLNFRYEPYIDALEQYAKLNNVNANIMLLNDQNGQAATVQAMLNYIKLRSEDSFWVMNCDTIVDGDWQEHDADVVVEVFESSSTCFSYINSIDNVSIIREKVVISNHASTGNYYFKSVRLFSEAYSSTVKEDEVYISDVINSAINRSSRCIGLSVEKSKVVVLGTPEQYADAT